MSALRVSEDRATEQHGGTIRLLELRETAALGS